MKCEEAEFESNSLCLWMEGKHCCAVQQVKSKKEKLMMEKKESFWAAAQSSDVFS